MTEPRSYFLNLNGPVPIWASGRLRSPYFSSTCLAATRHHAEAMAAGKYGTGYFSVNGTVAASAASIEATSGLGGAALRALEVGIEDAVERRLHVGGGEGLPVVPLHAAAQMEGVRLAVGRDRPALREIAGDLAERWTVSP